MDADEGVDNDVDENKDVDVDGDEDGDVDVDEGGDGDGDVDEDGDVGEDEDKDEDVDVDKDVGRGVGGDKDRDEDEDGDEDVDGGGVMKKGSEVWIEVMRTDGSTMVVIGEVVRRDQDAVVPWVALRRATWISSTGRRSAFFAGRYDENSEWEPYPDDMQVALEAPILQWGNWPHGLGVFRAAR